MSKVSGERFGGLWRNPNFLRLWGAQTVSLAGTQVSRLAIPLVAILTLDASATEVGIVAAAETLPYPIFGLFAGALVDRVRRKPILIGMDLARAGLFALLPLCWWFDWLSLPLLAGLAFAAGTCSVFFDVAAQSYLPVLVGRARLVDANSKFALSGAGTRVAGPGLGGVLIELISAPVAVGADAFSFLISGLLINRIRDREPSSSPPAATGSLAGEIAAGVGYVLWHPVLRPIAACTATFNLAVGIFTAVFVLFVTRELDITPGLLGLIFAAGGVGVLIGARLAGRLNDVLGTGRAIIAGVVIGACGSLTIALAPMPLALAIATLILGRIVYSVGTVMYDVVQVSLRQTVTPDAMLGRMNATIRVAVWGTLPLGSLLGGVLGEAAGLRPTLVLASGGMALAALWLWFSDVRSLGTYDDATWR